MEQQCERKRLAADFGVRPSRDSPRHGIYSLITERVVLMRPIISWVAPLAPLSAERACDWLPPISRLFELAMCAHVS